MEKIKFVIKWFFFAIHYKNRKEAILSSEIALESNNFISDCQFGFRPNKSTDLAVETTMKYVTTSFDRK